MQGSYAGRMADHRVLVAARSGRLDRLEEELAQDKATATQAAEAATGGAAVKKQWSDQKRPRSELPEVHLQRRGEPGGRRV